MTVAFISAEESPGVAVADPQNISLTVPASAKGVEVYVGHPGSTDEIVGMTLGGVALTRIDSIANTSASPERAYKYGLGVGVPTGARTLAIDRAPGSTSLFHVVVAYMSGTTDLELVDFKSTQGFVSNPSVALEYGGRDCLGLIGMQSSFNFILAPTADFSGQERVHDHLFGGSDSSLFSRQSTPGNVDFTMGYTMANGQVALIGTAWSEVEDELPAPSQPSTDVSGAIRSPDSLRHKILASKNLGDLVRILGEELPALARVVMTYERVAVLPYGPTVRPSGNLSRAHYIRVTDGSAFTIVDPDLPREGVVLRFDIHNASGGAMGAINFGSGYALQGAFTAPANTKHRMISFYRSADGKWRELSRSSNDLN